MAYGAHSDHSCENGLPDSRGDNVCKCDDRRQRRGLQHAVFQKSTGIHDAGNMQIADCRQLFMNPGTWEQCAISDGDIAQVLFLSK